MAQTPRLDLGKTFSSVGSAHCRTSFLSCSCRRTLFIKAALILLRHAVSSGIHMTHINVSQKPLSLPFFLTCSGCS